MQCFLLQVTQPEPDFRRYVFWAYGAVVVLLFFYFVWMALRTQRAERMLAAVKERLDQADGPQKH